MSNMCGPNLYFFFMYSTSLNPAPLVEQSDGPVLKHHTFLLKSR